MLKLYVRCCSFGHVVGFVFESALPQKHQDFKWALPSDVGSIWGSNARIEATFWAQMGAKFEVFGSYSSASCCKVGVSWGQVGLLGCHVEAKLGYVKSCWSYMSDFARPFGSVLGSTLAIEGPWWCYALPHGPQGVTEETPKTTPKTESPPNC